MAANVIIIGRRILVGLVTVGVSLALAADAIASWVGDRTGEGFVYFVASILMGFIGFSIESVKRFLGE